MKNLIIIILIFACNLGYGQTLKSGTPVDLSKQLRVYKPSGPDYSQTIYPENDGLVYNQYIGETIVGYMLANGWRRDTINGGYNKGAGNCPYCTYDIATKPSCEKSYVFYRYNSGKLFTGIITDTLYFSGNIRKLIFQSACINGLVQGNGIFYNEDGSKLFEGSFLDGEIVGEWVYYYPEKQSISRRLYTKGHGFPEKIIESTQQAGNK